MLVNDMESDQVGEVLDGRLVGTLSNFFDLLIIVRDVGFDCIGVL